MSNFLAFYSGLVNLGSSKLDVLNLLETNLVTNNGWQSLLKDTTNYILDVIPPVGETIGDGKVIEVVRIRVEDLKIRVYGYQKAITDAFGQCITVTSLTAGAVAPSLTINGATVTCAVQPAGNSAVDNLRQLWVDCRASANATFQDYNFYFFPPYPGGDATTGAVFAHMLCVRKTVSATDHTASGSNVTVTLTGSGVPSGTLQRCEVFTTTVATSPRSDANKYTQDVSIDLTNGFIYYMSVHSRSFLIASKTNTGYSGPVFATYIDNAKALAAVPVSTPSFATPIELFWGILDTTYYADTVNSLLQWVRPTHYFSISEGPIAQQAVTTEESCWPSQQARVNPLMKGTTAKIWQNVTLHDSNVGAQSNPRATSLTAYQSWSSTLIMMDNFAAHQLLVASGISQVSEPNLSVQYCPMVVLNDIYTAAGRSANEGLLLTSNSNVSTTNNGALDNTTLYTTVTVASTASFPSAGYFILNWEIWSYTGKTATTFTGCTRGLFGSKKVASNVGDAITVGEWFLRIQRGAIYCGYVKPV